MMTLVLEDLAGARVYDRSLRTVRGLRYSTQYPGGLCGAAQFFLALDPRGRNFIRGGYKLKIYDGLLLVWEGKIDDLEDVLQKTAAGLNVTATGIWGAQVGRATLNKRWVDTRVEQETWVWNEGASGAELCSLDRYNRLRFTPKGVAWSSGNYAAVRYTMPTGETIKRLVYNYQLAEGAQAWEISAWRSTDGVSFTQMTSLSGETYASGTSTVITTSSTGAIDVQLAVASQYLELRFYARGNQTPTEDGAYFGQFTSPEVYSELSDINLTEVVTDLQALSPASTDTGYIGANTYALEPFVTNGQEKLTDILMRAAAFGDSSQNPWAVGVVLSSRTRDGVPALFAEAQPVLTSYDYSISAAEAQLHAVRRNVGDVWNYIIVRYTDYTGVARTVTPADDATLKDTASIAQYGQKEMVLDLGTCGETLAINYGRRYLKKYKQPTYSVSSPLRVRQVYAAPGKGRVIPASQIQAGKRLLITDYLTDLSGTGLTVLITRTEYEHDSRMCSLSFGVPDNLAVLLAQKG